MITHIYFDWSGTLVHSGSKDILTSNCNLKEKVATLFPDTIKVLTKLSVSGYKIGIISNSKKSVDIMLNVLHQLNIRHLFTGCIIFTGSDTETCKKPCTSIFNYALTLDSIKPNNAIMVGNDYEKDILGARNAGIKAVFINRDITNIRSEIVDIYSIKKLSELPKLIKKF